MRGSLERFYLVIIVFFFALLLSGCSKQATSDLVVSPTESHPNEHSVRLIDGKCEVTFLGEQVVLETTNRSAVAYFENGTQEEVPLTDLFEWRGNSADYIGPQDIIGVWVDAPELSVTHVAPEALAALELGRVLIILLDGLSYYDLEELKPVFLSGKTMQSARTVMPSISPVALATILTGKFPNETGITSRDTRQLQVDDIFVAAVKLGKSSAMVEGSRKLINTSIDQLLNPDISGDGSTDDEVFACAKAQLDAGVDLIFVHFHGYDDLAHTYGPLSPETSVKMLELDAYVETLCAGFSGMVLVIADHGQHGTTGDKLGDHGEFRLLDLTIPWIQWEQ